MQSNLSELISLFAEEIADRVFRQLEEKITPHASVEKMLYNVPDAAVYLGRSRSGIRHLIKDRELRCVRKGSRVQLYKRDLDEFIEKHRI